MAVIKFQAFIQEKKYLSVRGEKNPWFGHRYSPIPCPKCDKTHINPNLGKHHSKKTRLQMSKSRKRNPAPWIGHNWGKTPCLKCNKIHGNAPAKGKHFTENHKKKLAEAKRGKIIRCLDIVVKTTQCLGILCLILNLVRNVAKYITSVLTNNLIYSNIFEYISVKLGNL